MQILTIGFFPYRVSHNYLCVTETHIYIMYIFSLMKASSKKLFNFNKKIDKMIQFDERCSVYINM